MDLGLEGKAVIVTGGSRGIGRAIAAGFVREGARVVICARGVEALGETATELGARGGHVLAVAADITEDAERRRVVDECERAFGPPDILVNNVGGGGGPSFLETSADDWEDALDRNLRSGVEMSRLVIPSMKDRGEGAILFIGSIFGREWGGRAAYMTVKAAEMAIAKAMARELAPQGIRVNTVAPGSILFPGGSWDRRQQEDPERIARFVTDELVLGRFGRPEEVADVVVFLASERASLVTGGCVTVDGGQSRSLI